MIKKSGLVLALAGLFVVSKIQARMKGDFQTGQSVDLLGGGSEKDSAEKYDKTIRGAYMQPSGDGWIFDENSPASQAFFSECDSTYYNELATLVHAYGEQDYSNAVTDIKNQEKLCRDDIIQQDQELRVSLTEYLGGFSLAKLQAVFASSSVESDQGSPDVAQNFRSFFKSWEKYNWDCGASLCGQRSSMRAQQDMQANEAGLTQCFYASSQFVSGLERLSANNCSGQREALQDFVERGVFSSLAGLQEECRRPSGCVADLRVRAGVDQSQKYLNVFKSCSASEEWKTARECCDNPEACDGSVSQYRAQLQNANAKGQAQCGAKGSQNFHNVQAQAHDKMQDVCIKATDRCEENCESLVADFKDKFLTCFVAPSFKESAFSHHEEGPCREHIREIIKAYNERAVDSSTSPIKRYDLALNQNENRMTVACNRPLKEMQDNLQARSEALAESLCNSEATQTAQDSQVPSVLSSPRSRDFGSSPPSTRNIVRHPAQADSLGPQEEEPVTRPGHIRVPGISHPVMEKAHYLENWAPDMGLEEEDLVYREGYSMPLMRDEAEEKDRAEANKGRDGYNRWGNKINPDLEPCPGPICDKHARFVPRAESAPSQQEEEEPSGPLEKVAGKTGDFVDRLKGAGGIAGAVAGGLDRFVDAWDRKEREAIRGAKRALRRVLGIRPGPKPPANKLTDAQKVLYEEFKNLMENAPRSNSLEEAMDDVAREERELLEWACMDLTGKTCAQMNRDAEAEMGFKLPDEAR